MSRPNDSAAFSMDYDHVGLLAIRLLIVGWADTAKAKQAAGYPTAIRSSPAQKSETRERGMTLGSEQNKEGADVDDDLHIPLSALATGYDQLLYARGLHPSPLDYCSRGPAGADYPGQKSAVGGPGNEKPMNCPTVFQAAHQHTGAGRERPAASNSCSHPPPSDRAHFRVRVAARRLGHYISKKRGGNCARLDGILASACPRN